MLQHVRRRIYSLTALAAFLFIIVIVAIVSNKNGSSPNTTSAVTIQNPSTSPSLRAVSLLPSLADMKTDAPTMISPISSPEVATTQPPSLVALRLDKMQEFIINNGFSEAETLSNPDTPQSLALAFLADPAQDKHEIPIPENNDEAIHFVQRYVLAVFYYSLDGPQWKKKLNFLQPAETCLWFETITLENGKVYALGASCNNATQQVNSLLLPQNGLRGILPDELRLLKDLDFIDIKRNQISGKIPSLYSALTKLVFWDMRVNELTGSLPDFIGTMNKLEVFAMSRNQFTGEIPQSFGNLTLLKTLALDGNNQMNGTVDQVNALTNLEYLYLEDNEFTGEITDSFLANHNKLIQLDLSSNLFEGTLPGHFFQYPMLSVLDLHDNDIIGTFPAVTNVNSALSFFSHYDNIMNGTIPESIKNLKGLTHLDLTANELTGTLPPTLFELANLTYLFLGMNAFTFDQIPSLLVALTKNLRELSLGHSNIAGTIPDWLGDMSNLVLLDLGGNQLKNKIPSELGNIKTLRYLLLDDNLLTGEVPPDILNLTNLEMLMLNNNSFVGTLEPLCSLKPKLNFMSADCNEIVCPDDCCKCCVDGALCNEVDEFLYERIDPDWEHSYTRNSFQFSPNILYENTTSE